MMRSSRIPAHGRAPGPSTFLSQPTRTTLFTNTRATRPITAWPISSKALAKLKRKPNEIGIGSGPDTGVRLTGGGAPLIHGGVRREEGSEAARRRHSDGVGESPRMDSHGR